jgi:hypothetical protein
MTKTEINLEVCNRHASSADIDEALRLLHGLRMAYYRVEMTGDAPRYPSVCPDEAATLIHDQNLARIVLPSYDRQRPSA